MRCLRLTVTDLVPASRCKSIEDIGIADIRRAYHPDIEGADYVEFVHLGRIKALKSPDGVGGPIRADADVSLARQIACIERELRMRQRVYPRLIATDRMTKADADAEIADMAGVLETLKALDGGERQPGLFAA